MAAVSIATRHKQETTDTISELAEEFLADLGAQGRSRNTVVNYRTDLRQLAAFVDNAPVQAVGADVLRRFMRRQAKHSPATRARRQATINAFFAWCVRSDLIAQNPAAKLPTVQRDEALPRPMAGGDVDKVLAAIPTDRLRDRLLFTLLAETGARVSEALHVYVEDVDLTRDNEHLRIRKPKGHRERLVLLADAPKTRRILRRFLRETRLKSGPLFRGRGADEPLTYRSALHAWHQYCEAAGVEATIHQLRHTVGTALVNDGLPLDAVRRRLGHKSLAMVQRYGEMSDEALKRYLRQRERRRH